MVLLKRRLAVDLTHHLDFYISQYNTYIIAIIINLYSVSIQCLSFSMQCHELSLT